LSGVDVGVFLVVEGVIIRIIVVDELRLFLAFG
jgi:hypothetical protein